MARQQKVTRLIEIKGDAKGLIKTLKDIDAATKTTARNTAAIQKNTKRMADGFNQAEAKIAKFSRILKGLGLFYLGQQLFWMGRSVVDFGISVAKANEQLTLMNTRLSRLGGSGGATNLAQAAQLADELGLTLEEAADNVALLAPAFERVGVPFSKVAKFTENLTKSMRVFGTDARRAQIVTIQLAQALGSGQLAGDELRSLNENAGQLGLQLERAVQSILKTTKTTKELGSEGKLTTDVMLRAFDKVFKNLEEDFEKLPDLLSFAAKRFENAWTNAIASVDRRFGVSDFFKGVLEASASTLNRSTINAATSLADIQTLPIQDVQRAFEQASVGIAQAQTEIAGVFDRFGKRTEANADIIDAEIARIQRKLEELRRTRAITLSILLDNATKDTIAEVVRLRQQMEGFSEAFVKFTMPQFDMGGASADAYLANLDEMAKKISQVLNLSQTGAANLRKFLPSIAQAAQQAGVSVEGLIAKMKLETGGFTQFANPKSSARGPGQIIEGTAKYLANKYNLDLKLIRTGIDGWQENIKASALYIAEKLKEASGDTVEAYARYFLGSGAVNTGGIDQTIGPNNGLTGRQYGNRIWKDQLALMNALGKETFELEATYENLQRSQEEAARAQEERERTIQQIRDNAKSELQKYLEEVDRLTAFYKAGDITQQEYFANVRQALAPVTAAQEKLTRAQKEQEEAVRESARAWGEFMAQFEQTTEFTDKMREGQRLLNQQLDAGLITTQQYAERLQQLQDALGELKNPMQEVAEQAGTQVKDAFGSWIDSAVDGTVRLRDALRELAADLAKLFLRNALTNALGGLAGGGGLGELLGGLFAQGAAFNRLALPQGVYTQPTFFQTPDPGPLKRYARGGVLGEAGPEAILPLRRMPSGDLGVQGGGTTVNINNYSGEPVSQRRRQLGDREIVDVVIGEVTEMIARGGNSLSRSFGQAYPNVRRGR